MLCDSCKANTGCDIGALRFVELDLKRPVQWICCLLHQNELPFRHLFTSIDGASLGPESYSGKIGKLISGKDGLTLKPIA